MSRNLQGAFNRAVRGVRRSLVRSLSRNRRGRRSQAGFVLPTVVMVLLVVVLLSIAILLRSFDRAKTAQYNRVDESVLQAATPALDRAKAKIAFLFGGDDPTLAGGGIPSERDLQRALQTNVGFYTLPDENQLELNYPIPGVTDPNLKKLTSAWRFPTDTNGDGKNDTYTLYGIYLRTPAVDNRARTPLEARTPPRVSTGGISAQCEDVETSASLIGGQGWSQAGNKLKKAVYVYVASVPIEGNEATGTPGFSALEYQQDVVRIPVTSNAVVYRDDLAIATGANLRINGRVITNSNLFVAHFDKLLDFYQVSGINSCFYDDPENSKILVGGNVVNGILETNKTTGRNVGVHLHQGGDVVPDTTQTIASGATTVSNTPLNVLSNGEAYAARLEKLILKDTNAANVNDIAVSDFNTLQAYYEDRTRRVPYAEVNVGVADSTLIDLEKDTKGEKKPLPDSIIYPTKVTANQEDISQTGTGNNGLTLPTGNSFLFKATNPDLDDSKENQLGDRILVGNALPATWYVNKEPKSEDAEQQIQGVVWEGSAEVRTRQTRVQQIPDAGGTGRDGFWEIAATRDPADQLDNYGGLRVVTGAGVYLRERSFLPPPILEENAGKIIAGRYKDPTAPTQTYEVVWPDTMPMSPTPGSKVYNNTGLYNTDGTPITNPTSALGDAGGTGRWVEQASGTQYKGDLQMRASVVYHYAQNADTLPPEGTAEATVQEYWKNLSQTPIACVSSYYDSSTSITAKNDIALGAGTWDAATGGKSNNGIVYSFPAGAYSNELTRQAKLVFPDGRLVNPQLYNALFDDGGSSKTPTTLAERAAVDATKCALGILDGTATRGTTDRPDDGSIYERAFLNGREVRAVDPDNSTTTVDETFPKVSPIEGYEGLPTPPQFSKEYKLALENRQPQEIRVTVLDMEPLRKKAYKTITDGPTAEYMLPMSGIIYATRNDGLPDITSGSRGEISGTDAKLDPTRRSHGIMLVHSGTKKCLARSTTGACQPGVTGASDEAKIRSVVQEKGLILASDLPVYVKGDFNLHTKDTSEVEEFTDLLTADWNNFYTRTTLDTNFACRKDDPRLPKCDKGDDWRPATVLADAVTLLSTENTANTKGFRFGFRNEGDFDLRNNAGIAQIGYDLDGNGSIGTNSVNESTFKIDINGDGDESDLIKEYEVTAKAARLLNGFNAYNNFATNGLSSGAFQTVANVPTLANADDQKGNQNRIKDSTYRGTTAINSSYFNNFVTPVQRRGEFSDYLMETCRKPFVAACGPTDWAIGYDSDGDGNSFADTAASPLDTTIKEADVTLADLVSNLEGSSNNGSAGQCKNNTAASNKFCPNRILSGGTGYWSVTQDFQRFPRRVAFLRDATTKNLTLDSVSQPVMVGIGDPGSGCGNDVYNGFLECYVSQSALADEEDVGGTTCYRFGATVSGQVKAPRCLNGTNNGGNGNALWFATNDGGINFGRDYPLWFADADNPPTQMSLTAGTIQQPFLIPVLQIGATETLPANGPTTPATVYPTAIANDADTGGSSWIMPAASGTTTVNLSIGTGDVPSRKIDDATGDFNGGLPNLPRLLENWQGQTLKIVGSFIQFRRSGYGTAPYQGILGDLPQPLFNVLGSATRYRTGSTSGKTPYFSQPTRNWGFDVGLLSQPADRFALQFANPSTDTRPDEFLREVSRNDEWVETLLCAKEGTANAVSDRYRPTNCP